MSFNRCPRLTINNTDNAAFLFIELKPIDSNHTAKIIISFLFPSFLLILSSPFLFSLLSVWINSSHPYINTTQRYKDTEKNKNSVYLCLCVDIDIRGFILCVAQSVTRERKQKLRVLFCFPLAYWNFDASHRRYFRSGKKTKTSCFVLLSARLFVSLTLETNYFS